ncbi:uncharacterized protein DEA37_0010462 [Paragonimus westermani]|uniref:E3 ubiquitin-protein ligase CBL n=1 Tax=Paragonimus westermani TaxID=34504 RepID=A0A5J4NMK5_9TREM|nr:uncharacterized protein DEA37_0010462 [Paragonimus westermani]
MVVSLLTFIQVVLLSSLPGQTADSLCVSWPTFIEAFSRSFHVTGRPEIEKLHDTIAFSSDLYVSIFGWDVFNRLFAPWNLLVSAWTKLVYEHPGYMAWMTFEDMRDFLLQYRRSPGTYAFRMSCRSIGFWSVAYVDSSGKVIQSVCRSQNFADFLEEGIKRRK